MTDNVQEQGGIFPKAESRKPKAENADLRIGLLGLGQVGGGVVRILEANAREIEARLGVRPRVVRALVRDPARERVAEASGIALVVDPAAVVQAPDVDVVVEVMGGLEPARTLVLQALAARRPVVTANKALLAAHGPEIFAAATASGVDVLFEAAVCGGVPIIRTLREALASDRIESVRGIVNGTTNFILAAMEQGRPYADALAEAQRLGFAEADPTLDVTGRDAAQKLLILASLAFGARLDLRDIAIEGIVDVEPADFAFAREFDCTVKLLATAQRMDAGLLLDVRPTLVPLDSTLAAVRGAFNAVELRSFALGPSLLAGQGAGALPTGSAVVSDIIEAGRNLATRAAGRVPHFAWRRPGEDAPAPLAPGSRTGPWYLRLLVADRPGVLARIAGALGERGISIASVIQRERATGPQGIPVVVETHEAREADVRAALATLAAEAFQRGPTRLMPIGRGE